MKNFFIISGSSGSGKTTLLELLSRDLNMDISVSSTTRNKRDYEIDGVHYRFISKEELQRTLEQEIPLIRQYVYRKAEQLGMKFSVRKFDNDTIDIRRLK